jgi:hypothetical protein
VKILWSFYLAFASIFDRGVDAHPPIQSVRKSCRNVARAQNPSSKLFAIDELAMYRGSDCNLWLLDYMGIKQRVLRCV